MLGGLDYHSLAAAVKRLFQPVLGTIGADGSVLVADSTQPGGARWTALGGSRVLGCDCKNNAGTPNTQYDLDAQEIHLRDANGTSVVRINPGAAITCNVSTAGPARNGRDQAGAFTAGSFVHFYWIWDGSTLATIASANGPATGPTLPNGDTHWCYATTVRFNGSSQIIPNHTKGSKVYYDTRQLALNSGSSTSANTAVDCSSLVPAEALEFLVNVSGFNITTNGSGAWAATVHIRVVSGSDWWFPINDQVINASATQPQARAGSQAWLPNIGQQFFYHIAVTLGTSPSVSAYINGYTVPNGGE